MLSLTLFSPGAFTPQMFANGALTAVFVFWGWDVVLSLNEETRNAAHTPGFAAILSMLLVLLVFVAFAVTTLMVLTDAEIQSAGTNVAQAIADKLFPRPWSYMAVVSVMLSTIGALEATILQFTRTMYAKSRGKALHGRFSRLHPTWKTPWVASAFLLVIGLVLIFMSSYLPTVATIMRDSVNAIGFQAAFYYGLASIACAWGSRDTLRRDPRAFCCVWCGRC